MAFEGFGPSLNQWNYCYLANQYDGTTFFWPRRQPGTQINNGIEGWQEYEWHYKLGREKVLGRDIAEVNRPYGIRLNAAGCATYQSAYAADARVHFGLEKTRITVALCSHYGSNIFATNASCPPRNELDTFFANTLANEASWNPPVVGSPYGDVGASWITYLTYELPRAEFPYLTQKGVFRFKKEHLIAYRHYGNKRFSFYETKEPAPFFLPQGPLRSMETDVPEHVGDVVITNPERLYNVTDHDYAVTFGTDVSIDSHVQPNCFGRLKKYRVDALVDKTFEFAVDNPPLASSPWPTGIPARPEDGPCQNAPAIVYEHYDGLVALPRSQSVQGGIATIVARGSKSFWGCAENGQEQCGNQEGDVNRYNRPTLEFRVDQNLWAAFADSKHTLNLSFGAKDESACWQPGWSWPAMNPATIKMEMLNPPEES